MADDGDMTRVVALSRSGVVLCLLAGVAFAIQPVVLDRVLGDGSPFALLAWRYLLAGASSRSSPAAACARSACVPAAAAFALGAVRLRARCGPLLLVDHAASRCRSRALVHYAHLPLVVGGAVLVTGRRGSRRQLAAVALVVAGVALVSGGAHGAQPPGGRSSRFGSALAYGTYMLLSARLLAGAEPLPAAAAMLDRRRAVAARRSPP